MQLRNPDALLKMALIPWGADIIANRLMIKMRFHPKNDTCIVHLYRRYPGILIHQTKKGLVMVGGSFSPLFTNLVKDIKSCIEPT